MQGRRIAAYVVIAAALAGCTSTTSGDPTTAPTSTHRVISSSAPTTPQPRSSTPASPSPTVPTTGPNVRPGEKQPTLPVLGGADSPAGAVAFASFWLRTLDWGYSTTSSALLNENSSRSCSECTRFARIFTSAKRQRLHFRGGHLSAVAFAIADPAGHDRATEAVDITYRQQAVQLIDGSDHVIRKAAGLAHEVRRLWLARSKGAWIVVDTKQVVAK